LFGGPCDMSEKGVFSLADLAAVHFAKCQGFGQVQCLSIQAIDDLPRARLVHVKGQCTCTKYLVRLDGVWSTICESIDN
jgi:hypothetical protein